MVEATRIAFSSLSSELARYSQEQFTGKLEVSLKANCQWSLYFSMGRLAWATGGIHTVRRSRRQITWSAPQLDSTQIVFRPADRPECWDYHLLAVLAQRQAIASQQALAVIESTVAEVLFDIFFHQGALGGKQYNLYAFSGSRPSENGILPSTWMLETEAAIAQAQVACQQWMQAGLAECSPDSAPIIKQPTALQQQTSSETYKNLSLLANGQRSLRDIALVLKQDTSKLTRSLLPYIRQGAIELVPIPDLPCPNFRGNASAPASPAAPPANQSKGLIACIDDSLQVCQTMASILAPANYEVIWTRDAVQALPWLLQRKPDAIFLDLVMPIANGYEICAQIRRVSYFQNTPVIILTGSDGLIDRVRAKLVGATDFLAKPVDADKVLTAVQKYMALNVANRG